MKLNRCVAAPARNDPNFPNASRRDGVLERRGERWHERRKVNHRKRLGMRALIALSLLLSATIGLAADPVQPARPEKDSRVCRDAAQTGTRIRTSECHLKSEWVAIDAERRKQYEDMNRRLGGLAAQQFPKDPTAH